MKSLCYENNVIYTGIQLDVDAMNSSQQEIVNEIKKSPHLTRILSSKKQIMNFEVKGVKNIYHLASGEVEIHNIENNMIISNVNAPAILGVSTMFIDQERHYIKTITNVEIYSIPVREFNAIIDDKNMWKNISNILSSNITSYYHRDLLLSKNNVYSIIRNQLEALWEQNSIKQEEISVFEYILHRTPVSRSSLNKVLKDLATGGYINLRRGKLINMNKLPTGY